MARLIGYMNMKEKDGKVLVLSAPIRNNGEGFTTYTKCVYGEESHKIDKSSLGMEINFTRDIEVSNV